MLLGAAGLGAIVLALAELMRAFLRHLILPWPSPGSITLLVLGIGLLVWGAWGLYRSLSPFLFNRRSGESLARTIYQRRQAERGPRIVAIGGGTGLSNLLKGLKDYTDHLVAIVTVADDGGSSGRLRRELGILPPGDIRNCLVALANAEPLMERLFQYRFSQGTGLEGHSFGNLFILALSGVTGSFEKAVHESSRILAVRGKVLPATLANITLSARMENEEVVYGESNIAGHAGRIRHLYIEPADAQAYPEAVKAIQEAQLIILGPGSLYTSILPNLLIPGIKEAVLRSRGLKLYVCNVATQPGETDGYTVTDHLEALRYHTGGVLADYVLVNTNILPLAPETRAHPVILDRPLEGVKVVQEDVVNEAFRLHHDPQKLGAAIMRLYKKVAL